MKTSISARRYRNARYAPESLERKLSPSTVMPTSPVAPPAMIFAMPASTPLPPVDYTVSIPPPTYTTLPPVAATMPPPPISPTMPGNDTPPIVMPPLSPAGPILPALV